MKWTSQYLNTIWIIVKTTKEITTKYSNFPPSPFTLQRPIFNIFKFSFHDLLTLRNQIQSYMFSLPFHNQTPANSSLTHTRHIHSPQKILQIPKRFSRIHAMFHRKVLSQRLLAVCNKLRLSLPSLKKETKRKREKKTSRRFTSISQLNSSCFSFRFASMKL